MAFTRMDNLYKGVSFFNEKVTKVVNIIKAWFKEQAEKNKILWIVLVVLSFLTGKDAGLGGFLPVNTTVDTEQTAPVEP